MFRPCKISLVRRSGVPRKRDCVVWRTAGVCGPSTALIFIRVCRDRVADNGLASGKVGNMNGSGRVVLRSALVGAGRRKGLLGGVRASRRGKSGQGDRQVFNECLSPPLWGSAPFNGGTGKPRQTAAGILGEDIASATSASAASVNAASGNAGGWVRRMRCARPPACWVAARASQAKDIPERSHTASVGWHQESSDAVCFP